MILRAPSSPGSQVENRGSHGLWGEVGKRDSCVCMCVFLGAYKCGEVRGRAGATESQNVSCGAGKTQLVATLLRLFWGNHNAEAREGCEQQICWIDSALEGGTGSLEMTQFLLRTGRHMLSGCGGESAPSRFGPTAGESKDPTSRAVLGSGVHSPLLAPARAGITPTTDCVKVPSPQGQEVLTKSPRGPWALVTSLQDWLLPSCCLNSPFLGTWP